jgi:pimeloyl-ACP methyl ester carboxylesterase
MTSAMFRSDRSREVMREAYMRFLAETPSAEPRRVATRFGETHLLVAGPESGPPLVVLHGAMASAALAIREGHPLLHRFRVYALDVLGQSAMSADVRLRTSDASYAEWLVDVLDALALPAPHVYAASWGGFIARRLAEHAPTRIDRLVLLVPAGIVYGPFVKGVTEAAIPLALFRTMGSRAALDRFVRSQLTTPDASLTEYLGEALTHYKLDLALPPLGTPEALRAFHRPTLVLAAARDINCPGPALVARAKELLPHAVCELLPDWKHTPPTDDLSRAKLCERVERFLTD